MTEWPDYIETHEKAVVSQTRLPRDTLFQHLGSVHIPIARVAGPRGAGDVSGGTAGKRGRSVVV